VQDDEMMELPVFARNARILFQGDSITDGHRERAGDPSHHLGHGYAYLIAARCGAMLAERNLTFLNRGISGNTVPDLDARWQRDTLDLRPDVLSVLIGVNDQGRGLAISEFEPVYDRLLVDAREGNPSLRLVLCEPFSLLVGRRDEFWEEWSAGMAERQRIVAKLAEKHGAALVRFQGVFDEAVRRVPAEYWIWDGVHPTAAGHQLMADEWVRVVEEFWR
jgi:lysophospholipase L1-like esterase